MLLGDERREIPQPPRVALVGLVEPAGADLRAAGPQEDLRRRCERLVVEVAEQDDGPFVPVPFEERVREHPHGCRLGRPAVQGVGAEACTLPLVARGEPPAGIGEELGLQVARDEVDPRAGGGDPDVQGPAAHDGGRGVVGDLHRIQLGRELAEIRDVVDRGLRHERDTDASIVGEARQRGVPRAADGVDEIGERLRLPDLLQSQHVEVEAADRRRERGDLRVVGPLVARAGICAVAEEVLHVPGADVHQWHPIRRRTTSCGTWSGR